MESNSRMTFDDFLETQPENAVGDIVFEMNGELWRWRLCMDCGVYHGNKLQDDVDAWALMWNESVKADNPHWFFYKMVRYYGIFYGIKNKFMGKVI